VFVAQLLERPRDAFVVPREQLVKGRHPKSTLEHYIPGFPSMRHLPFTVSRRSSLAGKGITTVIENSIQPSKTQ